MLHPGCANRGTAKALQRTLQAGQAAQPKAQAGGVNRINQAAPALPAHACPHSASMTSLHAQLLTSFLLHPLPHPEASGPTRRADNVCRSVSHTPTTAHPEPQGCRAGAAPAPGSAAGQGWLLVTSEAASPAEPGDNTHHGSFWGHVPRAFVFKIHINRHTYSLLKGHGHKRRKKRQLKYHPTFQPEKTT